MTPLQGPGSHDRDEGQQARDQKQEPGILQLSGIAHHLRDDRDARTADQAAGVECNNVCNGWKTDSRRGGLYEPKPRSPGQPPPDTCGLLAKRRDLDQYDMPDG